MPFQLADNGGDSEAAEGCATLWVKTVDCLHQRQGGNLDEVVVRLAPVGEATGQLVCKA